MSPLELLKCEYYRLKRDYDSVEISFTKFPCAEEGNFLEKYKPVLEQYEKAIKLLEKEEKE